MTATGIAAGHVIAIETAAKTQLVGETAMIEIDETAKIGENLTSLILTVIGEIEMILMIGIGEILETMRREMSIEMRGMKEGQKGLSEKMIGLDLFILNNNF